jgi:hypothetical protein
MLVFSHVHLVNRDSANNGHLDVIDVLVRNGADIESKDNHGMTPVVAENPIRLVGKQV